MYVDLNLLSVIAAMIIVPAIVTIVILNIKRIDLQQKLSHFRAVRRRLWLINTMNGQAARIENFRVNNAGQLPRNLAEIAQMFRGEYLGFDDLNGHRVECHFDRGGDTRQDKLNFSYLPPRPNGTERVDLSYYDPIGERWITRVIFPNGPKYEFV